MVNKKDIPLLEPKLFREAFIENKQKSILNNARIDEFFIHSFLEDEVQLKKPLPLHKKTVNDFVLVINGAMHKSVGLNTFKLESKSFLFTPKDSITTSENITENITGYYCHFSDDFLKGNPSLKFWHASVLSQNVLSLSNEQVSILEGLLRRILFLYRESYAQPNNYFLIQQYLSTFLAEATVMLSEKPQVSRENPILLRFQQLVSKYFKESRSVSFYADLIHISPNHLNKVVKTETGKSASHLIDEVCILEAKVLLGQTTLAIQEVALALGFEDPSYFNRYFKKHAGISPRNYRVMID